MTKLIRCIEGHVYDADENEACPICGAVPGVEDSGRSAPGVPKDGAGEESGGATQSLLSNAKPLLAKAKAKGPKAGFLTGRPRLWLIAGVAVLLVIVAAVYALRPGESPEDVAQNGGQAADAAGAPDDQKQQENATGQAKDEADPAGDAKEGAKEGRKEETQDDTKEGAGKGMASNEAKGDQSQDTETGGDDAFAALRKRAIKHFTSKDYDSAIADLTDIIRQGGGTWEDFNVRGMSHHYKKEFDLALADYDRAIALPEHLEFPHYNRSLILRKRGDLDGALAELNAAIDKHHSKDPSHYTERADLYAEKSSFDEAIADNDTAIDLLSKNESASKEDKARAYFTRGVTKERRLQADSEIMKDTEVCKDLSQDKSKNSAACRYEVALLVPLLDYEAAAVIDPEYAEAHAKIGWISAELGNYQKAIEANTRAIRLNPTFSTAYSNRCLAYNSMKQYDVAMADCNDAVRHDSESPRAWTIRGLVYATRRGRSNRNKAISDLRHALKLSPGFSDAISVLKRMGVKP